MNKLVIFLFSFFFLIPYTFAQVLDAKWGLPIYAKGYVQTLDIYGSNKWIAFGFSAPYSKTLGYVRFRVETEYGTVSGSGITVALHTDDGGKPSASATQSSTTTASTINSDTWVSYTGFTTALTAGDYYWIVFSNSDGSPTSNYITIQTMKDGILPNATGNAAAGTATGYAVMLSGDSGSTWADANINGTIGFKLGFSDSSSFGIPVGTFSTGDATDIASRIYLTRKVGTKFTTPNAKLRVKGIGMGLGLAGTPNSNIKYSIYQNTTLVASTNSFKYTKDSIFQEAFFNTVQELAANTSYRVVMEQVSNNGDSSNTYAPIVWRGVDTAATEQIPFSSQQTYYDGSSWTDDSTKIVPFLFTLEHGNQYGSSVIVKGHTKLRKGMR